MTSEPNELPIAMGERLLRCCGYSDAEAAAVAPLTTLGELQAIVAGMHDLVVLRQVARDRVAASMAEFTAAGGNPYNYSAADMPPEAVELLELARINYGMLRQMADRDDTAAGEKGGGR